MIQVCMSVWNEENRIGTAIQSVHKYVDRIVVLDGRYEGFRGGPRGSVLSTDHTKAIATKFEKVEYVEMSEALRPVTKRMLAFEYEDADWYMVLDADELMYGNGVAKMFSMLRETEKKPKHLGYKVKTFSSLAHLYRGSPKYKWTRIVHRDAGFHYMGNHWIRYDKHGNNMDAYCPEVKDVVVLQLSEICPDWRILEKSNWVGWRNKQKGDGW